jgi:hypothetical protein
MMCDAPLRGELGAGEGVAIAVEFYEKLRRIAPKTHSLAKRDMRWQQNGSSGSTLSGLLSEGYPVDSYKDRFQNTGFPSLAL